MKKLSLALLCGVLLSAFVTTSSFAEASDPALDLAIGPNKPTNGWMGFDFFEGRSGTAVLQRKTKGVAAAFRLYENGKLIQEQVISFSFKGRRADLKNTDFELLTSCVAQFNSVVANPTGGTFYVSVSKDDALGVLCAAQIPVAYK